MSDDTLQNKQKLFVKHYLACLNATQAAREAGYGTPSTQGPRLLKHPGVKAAIAKAMDARAKRLDINADWVLKELHSLYQRVMQEVKPALNSKTGKPITDEDGNALYTFNANAALKSLELIGKHIDVTAFDNKLTVEMNREQKIIDAIHEGRESVAEKDKGGDDETIH